jgi:hypothetical protein
MLGAAERTVQLRAGARRARAASAAERTRDLGAAGRRDDDQAPGLDDRTLHLELAGSRNERDYIVRHRGTSQQPRSLLLPRKLEC